VAVDKRNLFDILVKRVREIRHFTETELHCSADSYTYALPKGIERVEKWYRRTFISSSGYQKGIIRGGSRHRQCHSVLGKTYKLQPFSPG